MKTQHTALFVFGTRPEAIKMAPVVRAFRAHSGFQTLVCVTGQHRTMLDQVLGFFELTPDFDLELMEPNQTLSRLAGNAITKTAAIIEQTKPDIVLVQGDTTTAFAAAFAAFQCGVPVAHIEAGLRSGDKLAPFPEEMNRILTGDIASLHFAPLESSKENLLRAGITEGIHVVGNTVVDALLSGIELISERGEEAMGRDLPFVIGKKKLVLITIHRRESFGAPIREVFEALREIACDSEVELVYPVHLNPNVHGIAHELLGGISNIHLIPPLDYPHFIWMMSKAALIITDSGGVQEEAPSLGIPVLVAREVTERGEGVAAGCCKLVGTDRNLIVREARKALASTVRPRRINPYGDGQASQRILTATADFLQGK